MEFTVEFATFCNICFKNKKLRKIQESEHLLKTLTLLIENKIILNRHEIYLCLTCCEQLESYDQFKEMCLRNFLDFRIEYCELKTKLETCYDPNIEKKLRNFIETKIYEASDPSKTYVLEEPGKIINNVSIQALETCSIKKEDEMIDLKYDFASVNCKIENIKCEDEEDYKLHSESDLTFNIGSTELPMPIEHAKVENIVEEDMGTTESSIKNEYRNFSQSIEEYSTENGTWKERQIHTGTQSHICNICNRTFIIFSRLKKHMFIHTHENPHTCGICNKNFKSSENLKRHERVHTGEKPYACSMCDKTFTGSGNLKIHQRVHTGQKPYTCKVCDKLFGQINHLKAHERLHTGEKPYECTVCNERFTRLHSYKVHKLTHTGEKPHLCSVCNRTFRRLSNLREHERIHTGVKPYMCNICKKSFRQRSQFSLHKQKPCVQLMGDIISKQSENT